MPLLRTIFISPQVPSTSVSVPKQDKVADNIININNVLVRANFKKEDAATIAKIITDFRGEFSAATFNQYMQKHFKRKDIRDIYKPASVKNQGALLKLLIDKKCLKEVDINILSLNRAID